MLMNSNANPIFVAIQNLYITIVNYNLYIAIVNYIEVLDPQRVSGSKYSRPIALPDNV